ncbi:tRNA(Ile)-lysidine synthase [Terrihabitans soli]|uniref:tRNA(Ile)-lysidine synthase n=1 Tax=Terrihabitans soli TaxID=708113 RepID=A0A6S6QQ63_9HYPH|nr:tRNA lysidine(34) synthetase TilS [Terrihabitans soli]BCJ89895.1 tRNA(Ile)-lysidine synthase [Terrihabitans soli]
MAAERGLNDEETAHLFGMCEAAGCILLAVSGGADSTALLVLAAEWAKTSKVKLVAVTVDHGLRPSSSVEAKKVAALAKSLGVPHRIAVWKGEKPETGVEEGAREARYLLLDEAAKKAGATHLATAHTRDDQAETLLMRLAAGSGPAGLAGMRAVRKRGDLVHVRPFLDVPKARLVASLKERGIAWIEDETNTDETFARPRLRGARAVLEGEGLTAERLSVLARRMGRMTDAIDRVAAAAWAETARRQEGKTVLDGAVLLALPDEIALRLLIRAVGGHGDQEPDRLARSETLLEAVLQALRTGQSLGRTLAGAKISVRSGEVEVSAAPPRKGGT